MKTKIDKYLEEPLLKMVVNRETWSRVESFNNSKPDDRHYVMTVDRQGNGTVKFGDGKKGRLPPAGSEITATYRFGGGAAGNPKKKQTVICFNLD